MWGAPRIRAELRQVGCDAAESTVAKYSLRPARPPSPTWRSFIANHADCLALVDFFVAPTVTFRLVYAFVVMCHDRCRVAYFAVTTNSTMQWVARKIKEAFPFGEAAALPDLRPRRRLRRRLSVNA